MVDVTSRDDLGAAPAIVPVTDTAGRKAAAQAVVIVGEDGVITNPAAPVLAAGENHIGQVGSPLDISDVTPTLDTNIYASGDVLFTNTAVAGAVRVATGKALLQSLVLIDKDDQKIAMTLVFLGANSSLGAFNAAPDIDDTEALDLLGFVEIAAGDYKDLGGVSVVSLKNIGLIVEAASGTSIYVAAITGGTPTHTASGIRLRLGFAQG